jgi:hypothetical protein
MCSNKKGHHKNQSKCKIIQFTIILIDVFHTFTTITKTRWLDAYCTESLKSHDTRVKGEEN